MVLAVKVFEVKERMELPLMARKLRDFKEEEPRESGGKKVSLRTEILDLKMEGGGLTGIFSKDFILSRYYRRGLVEVPVTEEVPFWIRSLKGRTFLTVLAPSKASGNRRAM